MFAVIIQQDIKYGVQQVAVIPMLEGGVRQLIRDGKNLRGIAGAWKELTGVPDFVGNSVGEPVAVQLTQSDYRDLQYDLTPTTLVQKLVRTVKDENVASSTPFEEVYKSVLQDAVDQPYILGKYLPKMQAPTAPAVQPWVSSTPFTAEPEDREERAEFEAQSEPVFPSGNITVSIPMAEPVASYSTVAESLSEAHAILTIPEVVPYFGRTIFGVPEVDLYDRARNHGWNVLITGPAGTGKTSSASNYAAVRKLPFVTIECTQQIDQTVTQGRFVPTGVGNSTKWKYSQLATAIQQPCVILINELSRMSPKAASLFLRLLEERVLLIEPLNEVIRVHPGVIFIADQNTGGGYTGTSKQDVALVDRFKVKVEFAYDTKIESKFIKSPTLLKFAESIREASEINDEFSVPMSTRILKNFVEQAPVLNFEFAVMSMFANFPKMDGERDAIKMRFDADASAIADELGVKLGNYSTM